MSKWLGPSDEWAFIWDVYRGPISKARLAFYTDTSVLDPGTMICHLPQVKRAFKGRLLKDYVREWQADNLEFLGKHNFSIFVVCASL